MFGMQMRFSNVFVRNKVLKESFLNKKEFETSLAYKKPMTWLSTHIVRFQFKYPFHS